MDNLKIMPASERDYENEEIHMKYPVFCTLCKRHSTWYFLYSGVKKYEY